MRTTTGTHKPRRALAQSCVVALFGAAAACSVYNLDDLVSPSPGGSGDAGSADSAGASSQGATDGGGKAGGSGGNTPEGGSSAAGTSGTGGASGGSTSGGSSAEAGSGDGGDGGAAPGPDDCPSDPNKLSPGVCGCGIPDESTATLASCQSLLTALLHRYDFEGAGDAVVDRVGNADGKVIGAALSKLDGRGVVDLKGGTNGAYVDLPNNLVSELVNVTVESWLTWRGGNAWQRIFDFGDSTAAAPEDNPALGKTYLFATPRSAGGVAMASYSSDGNANGQQLEATASTQLAQTLTQVVVVANGDSHKLLLYIDGEKISEQGWTGALSRINDVNVWLGRSQYTQDPELNAVFHEFRVYGAALTDAQVATAFRGGPDPAFMAPNAAGSALSSSE